MNENYSDIHHPCGLPRYSHLLSLQRYYNERDWGKLCRTPGSKTLIQRARALDSAERSDTALYARLQTRYARDFWGPDSSPDTTGRARGADHGDTGFIADIRRRSRAYAAVTDALADLKPHIIRSSDSQLKNAFRRIEDAVGLGDVGGQFHSGGNEIAQARDAVMDTLSQLRPHIARARDSKLTATFNRILATVNRTSRPRAVENGYHQFSRAATSRAADAGYVDRNFRLQQHYDDARAGRAVHAIDISDQAIPAGRVVEADVFSLAATERAVGQFYGGRR